MNIILDPGSTFTTGSGKFKKKYTEEDELYPFTYTATAGGVITFSVNPVPDIPVAPARWTIPGSSDSAIEINGTVYNPYYNFSDIRGYFFPNTTPEFTSASIIEFEPDEYDQTTGTFSFLDDSYTVIAGPFTYDRPQDGLLNLKNFYSNFPMNSKYLYQNNPGMFRLFYDQANQGFLTLTNGVETWVNDVEQSSTIVIRQPTFPRLLDLIPSPSPVSPPAFSPSPRGSALTATPLPFPQSKLTFSGMEPTTIVFNSGSTYLSGTGYFTFPRIRGVSTNPVRNFTYTTVASTGVITFNGTGTQTTDYLPWGQEILVTSPIQNGGTGIWNSDPSTGLRIVLLQMIEPGGGTSTLTNRQYTAIGAPSPSPPPASDVPPLSLVMRGDSKKVIKFNAGSTYTSGDGVLEVTYPVGGGESMSSKPFTYSAGSAPNSIVITGTNTVPINSVSGTATWNTNRSTGLVGTFNYQVFVTNAQSTVLTPSSVTNVAFDPAPSPSPSPSPVSPSGQYTRGTDGRIVPNLFNLGTTRGTLQQCINACDSDQQCVAFSRNVNVSDIVSSDCWLKRSSIDTDQNSQYRTFKKPVPAAPFSINFYYTPNPTSSASLYPHVLGVRYSGTNTSEIPSTFSFMIASITGAPGIQALPGNQVTLTKQQLIDGYAFITGTTFVMFIKGAETQQRTLKLETFSTTYTIPCLGACSSSVSGGIIKRMVCSIGQINNGWYTLQYGFSQQADLDDALDILPGDFMLKFNTLPNPLNGSSVTIRNIATGTTVTPLPTITTSNGTSVTRAVAALKNGPVTFSNSGHLQFSGSVPFNFSFEHEVLGITVTDVFDNVIATINDVSNYTGPRVDLPTVSGKCYNTGGFFGQNSDTSYGNMSRVNKRGYNCVENGQYPGGTPRFSCCSP